MLLIVRVVVGSCSCTAFSEVSKLVNVNSVLLVGIETFDRACDFRGRVDGILTEGGEASDVGIIGIEDADGMPFGVWGGLFVECE